MAGFYRFGFLAFYIITKPLYEEIQDLIINTCNKLDTNIAPQSLQVYCHLPQL
jgi:hypothetical protein